MSTNSCLSQARICARVMFPRFGRLEVMAVHVLDVTPYAYRLVQRYRHDGPASLVVWDSGYQLGESGPFNSYRFSLASR